MSITTQIEDLAGGVPATISDIDDVITKAAVDVIRKVEASNPKELWLFTASTQVPDAGLTVNYGMVQDVSRGKKPCTQLDPLKRHRAGDSESIEFATAEFPVYYLLNGKVHVLPSPDDTSETFTVTTFTADGLEDSNTIVTVAEDMSSALFAGNYMTIFQDDIDDNGNYYSGTHLIISTSGNYNVLIEKNYDVTEIPNAHAGYTLETSTALCQHLQLPVVDGGSITTAFPTSYENLVAIFGAMVVVMRKMADLHDVLPTLTLPVVSVAPNVIVASQVLPTYSAPGPFVSPILESSDSIDFDGVPDAPAYVGPPVPALLDDVGFTLSEPSIPALTLLTEAPAPPESPSLSSGAADYTFVRNKVPAYTGPVYVSPDFPALGQYPDTAAFPTLLLPVAVEIADAVLNSETTLESLPVYSRPSAFIAPPLERATNIDFSTLTATPVYTGPVVPILPELTFSVASITIPVLELSVEIPVPPLPPNFSEGVVDFDTTVRGKVPQYIKPIFSPPQLPTISAMEVPPPPPQLTGPSFSDPTASAATNSSYQPEYNPPVLNTPDFVYLEETLIKTEEDAELASSLIQSYSQKVAIYQADLQDSVSKFNQESAIYNQIVQADLANVRNTLDKENQEFQTKLGQHNTDLQNYQAEVATIAQKWTKENIEHKLALYNADFNALLNQYQQDIAVNLNAFNKELQIYQAEVSKASADATNLLGREQNDYASQLQRFTAEIQEYQYRTTNNVAEWQGKHVGPAMAEYQQTHQDEVAEWSGENARILQLYQADSSEAAADFDARLKTWTQDISKIFQTYQFEGDQELKEYQGLVQAETARYQADSEKANSEHKSKFEKVQTEIQQYQLRHQVSSEKSKVEIENYNSQMEGALKEFQAKTEQVNIDFQIKTTKWTKENIEHKFNKWNAEVTRSLSTYQQDIAVSVNEFNKGVQEYQAEIQKALQDAQAKTGAEAQEYTLKLQKHQAEVDTYKTKTSNEVVNWQGSDIQNATLKFQQTRADELNIWQAGNANKLSKYQQETADSIGVFDSKMKVWAGELDKVYKTHELEDHHELEVFKGLLQTETTRYQSDSADALSLHKAQVEKIQAEIAQIQSKNTDALSKYQIELTAHQSQVQALTAEFQAKNEQAGVEYQWLHGKYGLLEAQYSRGFVTEKPKQGEQ